MLVLTRKLNERIAIGENIIITVVGVRGKHVRIGIEAPPEVSILRDELCRYPRPAATTAAGPVAPRTARTARPAALVGGPARTTS
jgi:carbon storage regulator